MLHSKGALLSCCFFLFCFENAVGLEMFTVDSALEKSTIDSYFMRSKRSLTKENEDLKGIPEIDSKLKPDVTEYELKDSHQQVMVDWGGEGRVVVCVTKDSTQTGNSTSNVYISYDYGKTFVNKSSEFKMDNENIAVISKFYKNEKFNSQFIFADTLHRHLFITSDDGHTLTRRKLEFVPDEVSIHPIDPFILVVLESGSKTLWLTMDYGENWRILQYNVKSHFWSEKTNPPTLYVTRENAEGESTVFYYNSFPQGSSEIDYQFSISNIHKFEAKEDFLFLVKRKPKLFGAKYNQQLELSISYKGGPFLEAVFPNNLTHQDYYIADVSYGQIMICVFHGLSSNLYVSSYPKSSNAKIRFSLSLERILYFTPSTNWNGTWLNELSNKSFADLHKVKGIRGVFIASQLYENYTKEDHRLGPEHLVSYITFDQGAEWAQIKPPVKNKDGTVSTCKLENGCSLHLSQQLSNLFPATQSKLILTSKSAPGMIIATGTLGKSLKGHLGVFMSSDAGASWNQILNGHYIYTIGDHGGILVAVQFYPYSGKTNKILFSIDNGENWYHYKFHLEELKVYGFMTEPGENTTVFSLYGSLPQKHEWIIIKIDLKPVFAKQCTKTDYKTWTPRDIIGNRLCLLGQKEVFERRIPHTNCSNGRDYDRPISIENCPCTREDYECDFGFKIASRSCIRDIKDTVNPLSTDGICREGAFYNKTKGYRKIPGDTCIGGRDFQYEPDLTPCSIAEENEFLLISSRRNILRYDIIHPEKGLQPLPLQGMDSIIALDFNMKTNCLFWSNVNTRQILRQCFDGEHGVEVIVDKNITSVEGLALDWISDNLYIVDSGRKIIEVLKLSNIHTKMFRKILLNSKSIDMPRGIALHPLKGIMFFTDWSDTKPMVAKTRLDGTNLEILFGTGQVGWPNGITIDLQDNKIFWADAKLDYIASADFDGKNLKKIIADNEYVIQPFAVAVYKSLIYWDDWRMLQVLRADKSNGWGITPLSPSNIVGLVDLKAFGHWTQRGSNSCGSNKTNTCNSMCIGLPDNGFTCLCPSWLEGVGDSKHNKKCVCPGGSDPTPAGVCETRENKCSSDMFMCSNSFCIPKYLRCDHRNDCGDYSDEKNCNFSTCDPPSWQCKNGHCISPAWKCDGDNDCGDNSDESECPEKSCPSSLFKCDNKKCIEKSWLCDFQDDCGDGSDERNCTRPNKTCKSSEFRCADNSSIHCIPSSWQCDLERDCKDGSDENNCTDHMCGNWQFKCPEGKCIYKSWQCDGDKDCSDGADEVNCTRFINPLPFFPSTLRPSHLWNTNTSCSNIEFACDNGNCILFSWRCDGANDCVDGSDEYGCEDFFNFPTSSTPISTTTMRTISQCKGEQLECSDGSCIFESWICDGTADCPSGEDENNCTTVNHCTEEEFQCLRAEGCIPKALHCDKHLDCADGSDEEGCGNLTPINETNCPDDQFSCDGGVCFENFRKCDGNPDCFDMTDEPASCSPFMNYEVENMSAMLVTNTSISFRWDMKNSNKVDFLFKPSYIKNITFGNRHAWINGSWTNTTKYTFNDLEPFTVYRFKVFVKEDKEYIPRDMLEVKTSVGVPTPPTNISVKQVMSRLQITWDAPRHPNGPMTMYTVYIHPHSPSKYNIEASSKRIFRIPIQQKNNLSISMTASNSEYTSGLSKSFTFSPLNVDEPVSGIVIAKSNTSSALLTWNALRDVDGYRVRYTYPENKYVGNYFERNVTNTSIYLTQLAPGMKYNVEVQGFKGDILGPFTPKEVITMGDGLPSLTGLRIQIDKSLGTRVKITWDAPSYSHEHIWQYKFLWGKSLNEIEEQKNVATTTNSTLIIRNLDACEAYLLVGMIYGPIGIGPVNSTVTFRTKEDPLSSPKHLEVLVNNNHMTINWMAPCPQSDDVSLTYTLNITEITLGRETYINLPTNKSTTIQSHVLPMHYGGQYEVSVSTGLEGSRPTKPVSVLGPMIPPPYELSYTWQKNSFFWRNRKTIPRKILDEGYTYVLYMIMMDGSNTSSSEITVEVKSPPYIADELQPGRIYLTSVALKDKDGYLSPRSNDLKVERPLGDNLVITKNNAVGVAVAVIVVIGLLIGLIAILVFRHRRLARSFLTFANTHYDRSQGTTSISHTQDYNLVDDDSPMIRGFSDDEPLVIA